MIQNEKMKFKTKELALFALLTAFCVVGRLLTEVVPNVQPITAVVLIVTMYVGVIPAIIISSLSMLITSFYLGIGIWTVAQILDFILLILLVSWLSKRTMLKKHIAAQMVLCLIVGLLYGFLITIMLAPFWGITSFWPYYLSGLPFDLLHGVGTAVFYGLLKVPLLKVFQRYHFDTEKNSID